MRSSANDLIAERNVFALINPKSGERAAAEFVRSQLEDHLAARRKRQLLATRGNQQQGTEREVSERQGESPPREKFLYNCCRPCSVVHALDFSRRTWRQEAVDFLARNIRTGGEQKNSCERTEKSSERGSEDCEREQNETATALSPPLSALAARGLGIEHHRRTSSYNVLGQQVVSPPTSLGAAAKTATSPTTDPIVENILIVAGGDGTVALAADLLNETGVLLVEIAETQRTSSYSTTQEVRNNRIPTKIVSYYHDKFSVHIAVIPMGTGNDLSRSLGFGPGFVRSQGCCEGDMSTMGPLIEKTVSGKAIDFDLWTIHVKPSLPGEAIDRGISGKGLRAPPVSSSPRQNLATGADSTVRVKNEPYEIRTPPTEVNERQRSPQRQEEHVDYREPKPATFTACISSSPSHLMYSPTIPSCSTSQAYVPQADATEDHCESKIHEHKALSTNAKKVESPWVVPAPATPEGAVTGNGASREQSPQQQQQQHMAPLKFNFVNYFSIGFDARICTEFHHLRQGYPSLCSSRLLNKAWYGILGLKALVGEPIIDAQYIKLFVDGRHIPIPPDIKSVVISNVVSFAGGVKLWSKPSSTKEYKDAEGKLVGSGECVTSAHWPEKQFSDVLFGNISSPEVKKSDVDLAVTGGGGASQNGGPAALIGISDESVSSSPVAREQGRQSKGGGATCSDQTQQTSTNKNRMDNDGLRSHSRSQNNIHSNNKNAPLVGKYKEANVGDGLLEVQGLYGSIHMSMLQMKARHSIKIAQGRRIEITIMYPELIELYHSKRKKNAKSIGREGGAGMEMEMKSLNDNNNQGTVERKGDADGTSATLTRSSIVIPTAPSATGRTQRNGHFKDLSTTPSVSPSMPRGTSQEPCTPLSLQKMPLIQSPSTPPALKTNRKEKDSSRNRSGFSSPPNAAAPTDAHLYSPDEALRPADLIEGVGVGRENPCGQHDGDVCATTHVAVGLGSAVVPPNESSTGAAIVEGEEEADEYSPHSSAASGTPNPNDNHNNNAACFEPPIESTCSSSANHQPDTSPQQCPTSSSTSRACNPNSSTQKNSKNDFPSDSLSTGGTNVDITPRELKSLPPPLAAQLDGEAMPKIEQMLQEYGAVTLLITRRQTASMLNIASPSEGEEEENKGVDGKSKKRELTKDNNSSSGSQAENPDDFELEGEATKNRRMPKKSVEEKKRCL